MKCLFSFFKKKRDNYLISKYCFICGKTFTDHEKYKKHIIKCKYTK